MSHASFTHSNTKFTALRPSGEFHNEYSVPQQVTALAEVCGQKGVSAEVLDVYFEKIGSCRELEHDVVGDDRALDGGGDLPGSDVAARKLLVRNRGEACA
jgi:hypothetical protein